MRGPGSYSESLFTTVRLEDFVPANHPLRPIRSWVNQALTAMDANFSAMYEVDIKGGRPSIAPEKLMRAMLLQVLYSVRSERPLVEQIQYNLLFRRYVGLAIEDSAWNHSVFSKNRDRLIELDSVTELRPSQSAQGRRICSRMDKPKAVTAAAYKLTLIYSMLIKGEEYTDQGQAYYDERYCQRVLHNLNRRAQQLGMTLVPTAPAAQAA